MLDIVVVNRQRRQRISPRALAAFLRRVAAEVPPPEATALSIALVSERAMRGLQRDFVGRDVATDVLSFPAGPPPAPRAPAYLGDVVIAVPVALRQARVEGHSLARELKLLTLHGYLHLLGHDHERDEGQMARLQRRLVRRCLGPSAGGAA